MSTNLDPEKPKRLYYVDEFLPSGRVHIIAGPSGAGKTTLLFQLAQAWTAGEAFLGKATHGQNLGHFAYVIGDRGADEAEETMERMNVAGKFEYTAVDDPMAAPMDFYKMHPKAKILAIDAGERLIEGNSLNAFRPVMESLLKARQVAEARKIAIILLVGSPKLKQNEAYLHGRERILGTSAWGRFSSTIFSISMPDPKLVDDPARILDIHPRNFKASRRDLMMTENGLIAPATPIESQARASFITLIPPGQWFERNQLSLMAKDAGINEMTLDSMLAEFKTKGLMEHSSEGKWRQASLVGTLPAPSIIIN